MRGTASGIFAPIPEPPASPPQRSRRSRAVFSQIRLAQYQPMTGAIITIRKYSDQKPLNGGLIASSTANTTATASTAPLSPPARLPADFIVASDLRSWKAPSQTSTPGRKSTPNTPMTTVSRVSRSCRIRLAARQCSTTVCGSMPKDCTSSPRAAPSIRTWTARANASPRLGWNSDSRGAFTVVASLMSTRAATAESRYAAEASACVAAVSPSVPVSGICAPGLKSNPSVTAGPHSPCQTTRTPAPTGPFPAVGRVTRSEQCPQ